MNAPQALILIVCVLAISYIAYQNQPLINSFNEWHVNPDRGNLQLPQDCLKFVNSVGGTSINGWSMEPFINFTTTVSCYDSPTQVHVGDAVMLYKEWKRADNGIAYGYPIIHQVVWRNDSHFMTRGTCSDCYMSDGIFSFSGHYLGKVEVSSQIQSDLCSFVKQNRSSYHPDQKWMCGG